jgi:hypothetical protein
MTAPADGVRRVLAVLELRCERLVPCFEVAALTAHDLAKLRQCIGDFALGILLRITRRFHAAGRLSTLRVGVPLAVTRYL